MTPSDWFSVGVRLLGVWMVLQAFLWLMDVVGLRLGLIDVMSYTLQAPVFHAIVEGSVGAILLLMDPELIWREKKLPTGFPVANRNDPSDEPDSA